ncbi:MAG: carboxypeptidase regulatory-like domain-containing protein [Bryobacteraceae bacterium]
MQKSSTLFTFALFIGSGFQLMAQDPTGTLEGRVLDRNGGSVAGATSTVRNLRNGQTRVQTVEATGHFQFSQLPTGAYSLTVQAEQFATYTQKPIDILVSQTARVDVRLELASVTQTISVLGDASPVDTATNTLGKTVSGREVLDLPLNGRNFTQLGLLQTGVAPLSSGVLTQGGSLRQGQAYAVNGQRPESNNYLLDGAQNVNRVDSGYALKVPVDAIAEFRILTHSAPPEYGGFSGSTTSVVTKGGSNGFHGSVYEFLRNDSMDSRNFFSRKIEPLKQNQFGGTMGGPIRKDRLFFFGYYEGYRNRQGITQSASVPTAAEREGDFSGLPSPLRDFTKGGQVVPGGKIDPSRFNPVAVQILNRFYPLGNTSPSVFTATEVGQNDLDQAGGRLDVNHSEKTQSFFRYSFSTGYNVNPFSVRGSPLPGFPVRDDIAGHLGSISNIHLFSPTLSNSARVSFLRYGFDFDQRINQATPTELGLGYESSAATGAGTPFFNISGYSPVGGAITGPRLTVQNNYELEDTLAWVRNRHSFKFGGAFRRIQMNVTYVIAPNAFFVYAGSFPTSDAFANFLLGRPVTFYQGIGEFERGLRQWGTAAFAQDEWRVTDRLTLNYGVRWEIINPNKDIRNRLSTFVPGAQSKIFPDAPPGILAAGDPGIPNGIARSDYRALMPRVGFAFDPGGNGLWSIRGAYSVFYDPFSNGSNLATQAPVSSVPWGQFFQITGSNVPFLDPYANYPKPAPNTFLNPTTAVVLDSTARPPYAQDWNLSIQRALHGNYLLEARYVGTKGTHLPRNVEANPAVYGPGATASNADRRRIYADCPPTSAPCRLSTVAMLEYITNSTYNSGQISLSHRYAAGFSFNVSYWYSKSLDYLSSATLAGASAQTLAGENDMAQNPFDLAAEHGLSLFDATHRFVASGLWELPFARNARGTARTLLHGWQLNTIVTANSGTPFTVYDSANVALQASSPPITGYFASRPDAAGDANAGPHTLNQWMSRSAFRRLNPVTQAGQFGNLGRNTVRGPAFADVDVSVMKDFLITESTRLQFRAESFNIANHPNFGLPVADIASANFGKVLQAGRPRLMQFALKLLF